MSDRANPNVVADLLLRFYREPMRYRSQMLRAGEILENTDLVLRLALGRAVELSEPSLRGPAIASEIERAAIFYVQQCMFREHATHYEVLGLAPSASPTAARENFRLLMQLVHPDRQTAEAVWPESFAARANRAYAVIKNVESRAAYDRAQEARTAPVIPMGVAPSPVRMPPRAQAPRRPVYVSPLPEWLTAGVGGVVRKHPAFAIFAGMIFVSALIIGAVALEGMNGVLARKPVEPLAAATPRALPAATPVPQPRKATPLEVPVATAAPTFAAPAVPPERAPSVSRAVPQVPAPVPSPAMGPTPILLAKAAEPLPPLRPSPSPHPIAAPANATPPAIIQVPVEQPVRREESAVPPRVMTPVSSPPIAVALVPSPAVTPLPATAERVAVAAPSITVAGTQAPSSAEVEALIASFVSSYEGGRLDTFIGLFDDDARTNLRRGRSAIRGEYDELFRLSRWRRVTLTQFRWNAVGDHTEAKGDLTVKIGWRDGREVEERVGVSMELVRQNGRAVIARLSHQPY